MGNVNFSEGNSNKACVQVSSSMKLLQNFLFPFFCLQAQMLSCQPCTRGKLNCACFSSCVCPENSANELIGPLCFFQISPGFLLLYQEKHNRLISIPKGNAYLHINDGEINSLNTFYGSFYNPVRCSGELFQGTVVLKSKARCVITLAGLRRTLLSWKSS